jgi:hypothetical protein
LLDADMIKFACMSVQCDVDIPKAVFLPDMGEYHAGKLIPAFKIPCTVVPLVFIDDALEFVPWDVPGRDKLSQKWSFKSEPLGREPRGDRISLPVRPPRIGNSSGV